LSITVIFVWGGFGSIWHGVIYDAADEIAKPPKGRSETWRKREIGELLACSGVRFSLSDHYYRAGGNYAC